MPGTEKYADIFELQRRIAVYEDEHAYKELFFLLYSPLKKFSAGFVRSGELAEEIVSDVFMEIWKRRKGLMEIADLKIYLYVSVKNVSLRKLQLANKNTIVSIDDFSLNFSSSYSTPEEAMLTSELLQKIHVAINGLPPRCKLIYKLAKEDRLQYKEISEILNISVKTIDNQLATAIKRIAAAINFRLEKDSFK